MEAPLGETGGTVSPSPTSRQDQFSNSPNFDEKMSGLGRGPLARSEMGVATESRYSFRARHLKSPKSEMTGRSWL